MTLAPGIDKNLRFKGVILSLILAFAGSALSGGTIPANRTFPEAWQNAGIGERLSVVARTINVSEFGAAGDGLVNDHQAVLDAIDSLGGQPGVIYFPAGTYLLRNPLSIPTGVVLRGESRAATTLRFDFVEHAINFSGSQIGSAIPFAQAAAVHSQSIELAGIGSLRVGHYALLTQDDDPAWDITDSWASGSAGQIVKIVEINGNQIRLEHPLRHDFPLSRNPRLRRIVPNFNAGIENLTLERVLAGTNSSRNNKATVRFLNAAHGWMRGVHSKMAFGSHVTIDYSTNIEITGCDFDRAHEHDGGGSGYGVKLQFRSGQCLIQDNLFRRLRHSILLQAGANGNVISYNYSREGKSDDHPGYASDISLHGNYPFANLFEGNIIDHIWLDTSHDGANGPLNTFFRNRAVVAGFNIADPDADQQNVVGNELYSGPFFFAHLVAGDGYRLEGSGHFTYGNYHESEGLQPSGTDDLSDYSYYLNDDPTQNPPKPDWWTIAENLPTIGPPRNFSTAKNIPARNRWTAAGELTVAAEVPELALSPAGRSLMGGSVEAATFTLSNTGNATLHWQADCLASYGSGTRDWITGVSPGTGSLGSGESVELTLQTDRSLLGADIESATLVIRSNGGEDAITLEADGLRYRITTLAGGGGSITPEDPLVFRSQDIAFSINAEPYHEVTDVWVDGVPQGGLSEYLWPSVAVDGTLKVEFAPKMVDTAPVPVPEVWLAENGITSALNETVLRDLDGDGIEVWREYVFDTDPNDSTSLFRSEIKYLPALNAIRIHFGPTSQQRLYTVESTSDLKAGSWQPVHGHEPRVGTDGDDSISLPGPSQSHHFYRLRVTLPDDN